MALFHWRAEKEAGQALENTRGWLSQPDCWQDHRTKPGAAQLVGYGLDPLLRH